MERHSREADADARAALRERFGELVTAVMSYGAVDVDPAHLVVWVLLAGSERELPQWFFPTGDERRDAPLAFGLSATLYEIRDVVRERYASRDWPNATGIRVGFDSYERVKRFGFDYFK